MHDKNGTPLKRGDRVTMEFIVTETSEHAEYCNVHLKSVEPLYPGESYTDLHAVNTKQVVKVPEQEQR